MPEMATFLQKFGEFLKPNHTGKVLGRVSQKTFFFSRRQFSRWSAVKRGEVARSILAAIFETTTPPLNSKGSLSQT